MKILIKAIYSASRYTKLKQISIIESYSEIKFKKIITYWHNLIPISYYYGKKTFWNIPSILEKVLCSKL